MSIEEHSLLLLYPTPEVCINLEIPPANSVSWNATTPPTAPRNIPNFQNTQGLISPAIALVKTKPEGHSLPRPSVMV